MGLRTGALMLVVALIAALAALNWGGLSTPTVMSLGVMQVTAPLGLIMLGLTALLGLMFLIYVFYLQSTLMLDSRRHTKELQAQRELADKAEASRFTDLRQHFDAQMREIHQRDGMAGAELEKAVAQGQRELRTQLELMNKALATRLADIEGRLEGRSEQRARTTGAGTI